MKRNIMFPFLLIFIAVVLVFMGSDRNVYAEGEEQNGNYGEQLEKEADENVDHAIGDISNFTENTVNLITDDENGTELSLNRGRQISIKLLKLFYRSYIVIKAMAGVLITVSIFLGVLIYVLCRKNKKRRRLAIYGFCIGFPLLILAIVYGVGILNGIYLTTAGEVYPTTEHYDMLKSSYQVFAVEKGSSWFVTFLNGFDRAYDGIKVMAPAILLMFEAQGLLRVFLCKYEKRKKDIGLYGYCIGIPLALLLVVIGAKFLGGAFI